MEDLDLRRAGLTQRGMFAPFVPDGSINRLAFETQVEKVLIGEQRPGDIVILDNLFRHVSNSI